jgi:hypothetical protein
MNSACGKKIKEILHIKAGHVHKVTYLCMLERVKLMSILA